MATTAGRAYWGFPNDIWRAWGEGAEGLQDTTMRAPDRERAKAQVLKLFPNARFYR